jgi:hypothetical protein
VTMCEGERSKVLDDQDAGLRYSLEQKKPPPHGRRDGGGGGSRQTINVTSRFTTFSSFLVSVLCALHGGLPICNFVNRSSDAQSSVVYLLGTTLQMDDLNFGRSGLERPPV